MKKTLFLMTSIALLFTSNLNAKDVYGEVNGQKITKTDIAMLIKNPNIDFDKLPKKTQDDVLNQLVEKMLLTSEALKSGVSETEAFKDSLEKIKADLAFQFWAEDMAKKIVIADDEAQDFYKKNIDKFANLTKYRARHILVKTKEEAQGIIKELQKSKKLYEDFIKIANTKTEDPSGKTKGGDLGWFELGKMVPEFSNATRSLKVGSFTMTPVKTDYGYHVIYLEDKKEVELASVKQILVREKFAQQLKSLIDNLKKSAVIKLEN